MYKRAVELAPSSPQYACNLADQYFKHGEYTEGIRVYGGIREFPLAALESAKIYRLLGDLKAANDLERVAIGWMGEPAVAKSPESRLPWSIESGGAQPVSLSTGGARLRRAVGRGQGDRPVGTGARRPGARRSGRSGHNVQPEVSDGVEAHTTQSFHLQSRFARKIQFMERKPSGPPSITPPSTFSL